MSRRQALGVISNQCTNQFVAAANALKSQHPLKSHPSLNSFNNENEKPCMLLKKSSDFDFEIFQDKENVTVKKQATVIFSNDYDDDEDEEEDNDEDEDHYYVPEEEELDSELDEDEEGKIKEQLQQDMLTNRNIYVWQIFESTKVFAALTSTVN